MRNMFRPKNKKPSSGEIRALPLQRQWKQAYITTIQPGGGGLRTLDYVYLAQYYQEPKLNEKETRKGLTSGKRLT